MLFPCEVKELTNILFTFTSSECMKRIALISDTHGYLEPLVLKYVKECHEIWHAGDVGSIALTDELNKLCPVRAVYGNIDGQDVRKVYPEVSHFVYEGLKVLIIHIGGYPGAYTRLAKQEIEKNKPDLFVSGHSHILKIMPDKKNNLLHMNPGACGNHGFHPIKTMIRFTVLAGKITEVQAIELGKRA